MMPTPTTFTVASTAVYRSADGNDARQFFAGDVIDYTDAIHFQMVAAPAALPPIVGGLRLDPSNFAMDADGVVTVAGGLAVSSGFVYVFCPPTFDSVPSMPGFAGPANGSEADYTVWGVTPGFTASLDLSGVTQVRCVALVHDTGPAGYVVKFKYSSDNEATFHDLVSGGFQFAADATGWADTGWQSLVAGALTSVIIHPFVQGSDNVAVAHIEPLTLQFK